HEVTRARRSLRAGRAPAPLLDRSTCRRDELSRAIAELDRGCTLSRLESADRDAHAFVFPGEPSARRAFAAESREEEKTPGPCFGRGRKLASVRNGSVALVFLAIFLFGDELVFVLRDLLLPRRFDRGGVPLIRMQREA